MMQPGAESSTLNEATVVSAAFKNLGPSNSVSLSWGKCASSHRGHLAVLRRFGVITTGWRGIMTGVWDAAQHLTMPGTVPTAENDLFPTPRLRGPVLSPESSVKQVLLFSSDSTSGLNFQEF